MVICCTSYNTVIAEATYVEMHMLKKSIKRNIIISHDINNNNDDDNCNCNDNSINNNDDDNKKNNYIHILNGLYLCTNSNGNQQDKTFMNIMLLIMIIIRNRKEK